MKNDILEKAFRIAPATKAIRLKDQLTRLPRKIAKDELKKSAKQDAKRIGELQQLLYPENSRSLLLIFQAMDAAGKDSCIARVLRYVSPQGCQVTSYKAPSSEELVHDFLWRHAKAAPAKGMIGVHNRSHYEEVLVVKVHPGFLAGQHLHGVNGAQDPGKEFWEGRYASIRNFEAHLAHQGTVVMKFFLHMGKEAQKKRFLERIEKPEKNWKFNAGDLKERALWDKYMEAYETAIRATSTQEAPWYVVPADRQWETCAIVCRAVRMQLQTMAPKLPVMNEELRKLLPRAARMLRAEKP